MSVHRVIVSFDVEAEDELAAVDAVKAALDVQAEREHMSMGTAVLGDFWVREVA